VCVHMTDKILGCGKPAMFTLMNINSFEIIYKTHTHTHTHTHRERERERERERSVSSE